MHSDISISSCFPSVQSAISKLPRRRWIFARRVNRTSARAGILSQRHVFRRLLHDAPHPCRQPPGPCRRQPRQPPGASAPLRSATPLCCGAPTLSDGGSLSLLPLASSSSGHTLSSCLWSHGPANRYHAETRKEQARQAEHRAEAEHELLSSGPWTPLPPAPIPAHLALQPPRLRGRVH